MARVDSSPSPGARLRLLAAVVALACAATACNSLAPDYQRATSPVPARFDAPAGTSLPAGVLPDWQALVPDAGLRQLVEIALANNRDLAVAALNVERARAAQKASNADFFPTLGAGLTAQRGPDTTGTETNLYQAGLSASTYEVDLFGRLRSNSDAAAANVLGADHARRAVRLALITQVLSTALAIVADEHSRTAAQTQLHSRDQLLRLTRMRAQAGSVSDIDLATAVSLSAQARAAYAQAERARLQDRNALALVLGQPVPATFDDGFSRHVAADPLAPVPVDLDSTVLLARPDVMQAEQGLVAANANIGAARAAFFPRLTLTGSVGRASQALSDLASGSTVFTVLAQAAITVFDGGRNEANLSDAKLGRDVAVRQYEKSLQTAFREVNDALAGLTTWNDQRVALEAQQRSESDRLRLTRLRYDAGAASQLDLLDAERSLAAADQSLVQTRLAEWQNRLALYRALGGSEDIRAVETATAPASNATR